MADRVCKLDMTGYPLAKKTRSTLALGPVKKLVRNNNVPRDNLFFHAANRRDRDNALYAKFLHPVDIRPIRDFGWEQFVATAVPRQEHHLPPIQNTGDIRITRISESCTAKYCARAGNSFHRPC